MKLWALFRGILIINLFFNLTIANAKRPNMPEQETLNSVSVYTDTIFLGTGLMEKRIKDGMIYENGEKVDIILMKIRILKAYRGDIHKDDIVQVCTWYDEGEHDFGTSINNPLIYFGNTKDKVVFVPRYHGYIEHKTTDESKIYKSLQLRRKKIDRENLFGLPIKSKIIRNLCMEYLN
jgi:hypothetical protein